LNNIIKNFIRKHIPKKSLAAFRKRKSKQRTKILEQKKANKEFITEDLLSKQLKNVGIGHGETLLVHSSMSKIGYLKDGPKTLVDGLLNTIGKTGNLLMPSSPNPSLQLDYIKSNPVFDVKNSPSKMGAVTEYFRKLDGTLRSLHPTEPVSAYGPDSFYLTEGHFGELTPYTSNSPFYRITEKKGKILMIGVTLSNAGTSLHTLEDDVDFKFPIYYPEIFEAQVIDEKGIKHIVRTKVHNPEYSKKRKCDELIDIFEKEGALQHIKIGEAKSLLLDAKKMFDVMIKHYTERGVTMYTPKGID